jgi:hypothetical protein
LTPLVYQFLLTTSTASDVDLLGRLRSAPDESFSFFLTKLTTPKFAEGFRAFTHPPLCQDGALDFEDSEGIEALFIATGQIMHKLKESYSEEYFLKLIEISRKMLELADYLGIYEHIIEVFNSVTEIHYTNEHFGLIKPQVVDFLRTLEVRLRKNEYKSLADQINYHAP